jgi:hypothetical protein
MSVPENVAVAAASACKVTVLAASEIRTRPLFVKVVPLSRDIVEAADAPLKYILPVLLIALALKVEFLTVRDAPVFTVLVPLTVRVIPAVSSEPLVP